MNDMVIPDTVGWFGAFSGVLVGLVLGSFAGMASWRWPREQGWTGSSRCPHCGHRLTARELVPVFSWLWQKGRAACCQAPVSGRYALIEATCAVLTGLVGWHSGLSVDFALLAVLISTLVLMSVIDLETGLLPDGANLTVGLLGLVWACLHHFSLTNLLLSTLQTGGVGIALAWGYSKLRGRDMLGWGDVKLMAAAGPWLWPEMAAFFLAVAGFTGLVFGVIWKKAGRHEEFPFGPSLAAALLLLISWQALGR